MNEKNIEPTKIYLNRLSRSQRKATIRSKYYSTKILWKKYVSVTKEIIEKMHQHNKSKLALRHINDKKCITLELEIAKKFNELFTEIGPHLAWKIPTPSKPFGSCFKKASTTLPERYIAINKLKNAFFSLKKNKSIDADEISLKLFWWVKWHFEVYFWFIFADRDISKSIEDCEKLKKGN